MNQWIDGSIENANWMRLIVPFVLLIAYSLWLFRSGGEFTAANNAVGMLPEMQAALSVNHNETFVELRDAKLITDYTRFQLLDIPYAILNFFTLVGVISLAMKRFGVGSMPLRYILLAPALYLVAEFFENAALFAMANNFGVSIASAIQPIATVLKFCGTGIGTIAAFASLLSLIGVVILNYFRKSAK